MKKISNVFSVFAIILVLLVSPFVTKAATVTFTQNLRFGSTGSDVLLLQQKLNADSSTIVALQGAGSPGYETGYYGSATVAAVKKFQIKYASEVLAPAGLTAPSGIFGTYTRAKMNSLLAGSNTAPSTAGTNPAVSPTTNPATNSTTNPASNTAGTGSNTGTTAVSDAQQIAFVKGLFAGSPGVVSIVNQNTQNGTAGTVVTLYGNAFASTSDSTLAGTTVLHFGNTVINNPTISEGGAKMTFTVPSLPYGIYNLSVTNRLGTSNLNHFFVVTDPSLKVPKVLSITPNPVAYGASVTIAGENFTALNRIQTEFESFDGVPSTDGKTITFTFKSSKVDKIRQARVNGTLTADFQIPLVVMVVNNGGASQEKITYSVQIQKAN